MTEKYTRKLFAAALLACGAASATQAQTAAQQRFQLPGAGLTDAPQYQAPKIPKPVAISANGEVVEDVIVRINDRIITRSEYQRSIDQLIQEAQQNHLSPSDYDQRQKDLLRDMIDQQLLLSKGKDLGITGDAETLRRLDEIRKQYHLDSMEALEKAATQQGVSYEDFKANIRNGVITQQVVRDEVGRRVVPTRQQEQAYYDAHQKEFDQPESIHLSEILIPTPENATDAVVTQAQAKADDVAAKLKAGGKFTDLAKQYSGDTSASRGGELGDFKRGQLGQVLEDATFPLPVGGITAPIRTRQGFVILKVDTHSAAGAAPLTAVEGQVQEAIYMEALQPALRAYLTKARQDAYLDIKPGFVDSGSGRKDPKTDLAYTTYTPPKVKKKTETKRRLEAQKDAMAQQKLADARAKASERAAEKAAKASGVKDVSGPKKQKKIKPEKIRFGQAPRNSLPSAPLQTAEAGDNTLGGQAPGVAMAAPTATTTITTGGVGADPDADPLAPKAPSQKKTRYTARQADIELAKANDRALKAHDHLQLKPVTATKQETADETHRAAPLGLRGDTVKKADKKKRQKGDKKERLQEKPKPVDPTLPIDPTVNKNIGVNPVVPTPAPTADQTTLPPVNQPAPGVPPNGQPLDPSKPVEPANTPSVPH